MNTIAPLTSFLLLLLALQSPLFAQDLPASDPQSELKKIERFNAFFEPESVGNLHVYAAQQEKPDLDYFFIGEAIPRGYFDLIDPKWRSFFTGQLKAYAVRTIKGTVRENPYYLIRMELAGARNSIELFELENGYLQHKQQLASYWCNGGNCVQIDSWIQDLDGDTQFDIIKKVRIIQPDLSGEEQVQEDYHLIYKQEADGSFNSTHTLSVDIKTYNMESLNE